MWTWKRRPRKRVLRGKNYERLKREVCIKNGFMNLCAADLDILRRGEAAFVWESLPAASDRIAVNMARQAALEMAPAPGRVVLAAVLHITANIEIRLETIEEMAEAIQQSVGEDACYYFSTEFCDEGTHFILATAEGRADREEHTP